MYPHVGMKNLFINQTKSPVEMKPNNSISLEERIKEIIVRCDGDSILDVGCVETQLRDVNRLHEELIKRFSKVIGIDIQKRKIQELKKMGYDVRYGNAEDFELGENFDIIVAGELIEHLSNPGRFLDACRNHLKEEGIVILTTPNPFWVEYPIRIFLKKLSVNLEHTAWYDESVLTHLAERHLFEVVEVKYIIERYAPNSVKGFVYHKIVFPILIKLLHEELTAEGILVILKKKVNY